MSTCVIHHLTELIRTRNARTEGYRRCGKNLNRHILRFGRKVLRREEGLRPLAVRLEGVSTTYEGEERPAIRDINLSVRAGELVTIIGPNGAGKTTLLETINGLLRSEGLVEVLGLDVHRHGREVRRKTGYVPQDFMVPPDTPFLAKDVVMMGRVGRIGPLRPSSKRDWEIVMAVMEELGIADLADRPIGRLSGGQQQKVMIARALAKEPELLLLDEPFSSLDARSRRLVCRILADLREDREATALVVTHDLSAMPEDCDKVVLLNGGRITAQGEPEEVFSSEAFLRAYGALRLVRT
ncbi:metal ABC transporter ATP-binding protein [Candidatus Bathyarchaeota archaeon]|nr:MAG: metal ABC transporter ATP-binding protein [Candidatus Bathyarchaeota archaeon]